MGFIGKVLVVLHGALAVAVLAWAIGVYTHRVNWNTPATQAGKEPPGPGLFDRQKDKAAEYNVAVDRSYTRWTTNLTQVQALENERYPRRAFYARELEFVRAGGRKDKDGRALDPVLELATDPATGFLDPYGKVPRRPVMVREGTMAGAGAVAARSIDQYGKDIVKAVEDIQASQKKNGEFIDLREKLNREIVGVTDPTPIKGLRTQLAEQKVIEDQANFESVYVTGFVTNREAEFGLLKKRRDAMQARMTELEKFTQPPPKPEPEKEPKKGKDEPKVKTVKAGK